MRPHKVQPRHKEPRCEIAVWDEEDGGDIVRMLWTATLEQLEELQAEFAGHPTINRRWEEWVGG